MKIIPLLQSGGYLILDLDEIENSSRKPANNGND